MAKRLPGILPGEQNKGNPGKGPRLPSDPAPSEYNGLKKAFKKPGLQPGEKDAITRIAANRGVDRKAARKIALNRTSKGLSIKGTPGPAGLGKKEPKVRVPVDPQFSMGKRPTPKEPTDPTVYPAKPTPGPKLPMKDVPINNITKKMPKAPGRFNFGKGK